MPSVPTALYLLMYDLSNKPLLDEVERSHCDKINDITRLFIRSGSGYIEGFFDMLVKEGVALRKLKIWGLCDASLLDFAY